MSYPTEAAKNCSITRNSHSQSLFSLKNLRLHLWKLRGIVCSLSKSWGHAKKDVVCGSSLFVSFPTHFPRLARPSPWNSLLRRSNKSETAKLYCPHQLGLTKNIWCTLNAHTMLWRRDRSPRVEKLKNVLCRFFSWKISTKLLSSGVAPVTRSQLGSVKFSLV